MATLPNGYKITSTFISDFAIADAFGVKAVKDTYNRAFKGWKHDHVYMTELEVALNLGIWKHYRSGNKALQDVYSDLWERQRAWCFNNFNKEELSFHFRVTD